MSAWLYVPLLLSQNYLLVARQADLVLGRTKSCKFRILSTSAVLLLFSHSFTYWHLLFLKADLSKIRRMVELEGVVQLSHLLMKIYVKRVRIHCKKAHIEGKFGPRRKGEFPGP